MESLFPGFPHQHVTFYLYTSNESISTDIQQSIKQEQRSAENQYFREMTGNVTVWSHLGMTPIETCCSSLLVPQFQPFNLSFMIESWGPLPLDRK